MKRQKELWKNGFNVDPEVGEKVRRWLRRFIGSSIVFGPNDGQILQNYFANFWRARSRLYQNEILQENMRSTAFFKPYKMCILLHRCNLKNFAKNRLKNQQFS